MRSTLASYFHPPLQRFAVLQLLGRAFLGTELAIHFAIRRHEFVQHAHFLSEVSRVVTLDGHFRSRLDYARLEPVSNHSARSTRFKGPSFQFAVGPFHVQEEPGVRIFQPYLDDDSFDRNWIIRIVGRRK